MNAVDGPTARSDRKRVWRLVGAPMTAAVLVAMLVAACSSVPERSPTAAPAASSSAASAAAPAATPTSAAPTASLSPAYADRLRIAFWNLFPYRNAEWAQPPYQITLGNVVTSALYRYDARYGIVPDLADGPCVPQGDGTVIRCHLIETTFQDGTPLTSDDVAYSYRLFGRDVFNEADQVTIGGFWDRTGSLKEVRVVDPRTVDFGAARRPRPGPCVAAPRPRGIVSPASRALARRLDLSRWTS